MSAQNVETLGRANTAFEQNLARVEGVEKRLEEQQQMLAQLVTGNSNLWQYVTGSVPPSPDAIPKAAMSLEQRLAQFEAQLLHALEGRQK